MTLTVVMYHYVRPRTLIEETGIPGLDIDRFVSQLRYLKQNHTIIDPAEFLHEGLRPTPRPPALLTFDDAYIDHYEHAMPVMLDMGLSGIFFAPAQAIRERRVLDVNKIHVLLGVQKDRGRIIDFIHGKIADLRDRDDILPVTEYERLYRKGEAFKPGTRTFDDEETTYIKRILQVGLPRDVRRELTNELFVQFVEEDEHELADRMYCSEDQLREMVEAGMHVGGHGHTHEWMEFMDDAEMEQEVRHSAHFVDGIYGGSVTKFFAYPYGSHDERMFPVLRDNGFAYAFTTMKGCNAGGFHSHMIERLDTNDVPFG